MSATINTIPASTIVDVIPSVLNAGGSALDLIGLLLASDNRTPIGSVLSFPTQLSVSNYYGPTSVESLEAAVYFSGVQNGTKLPAAMLIAQYNQANVGAYLRGGSVAQLTLAQLQALTGTLIVTIDGVLQTSSAINLAASTSFSNAGQIISNAFAVEGPQQASFTASRGSAFTGTAAGTNLTVSAVTGTIHVGPGTTGDIITGTGIVGTVYLLSQTSGTPGGAGVYVTSASTTASAAAIVGSSLYLDVTVLTTGVIAVGQEVNGAGIAAGTFITALGTGTGGVGSYICTNNAHVVSEAMTTVTPLVTYDSIAGAFVVVSATTGAASTISFGTGTIAASLKLTSATGAVLSQGAVAATPTAFMNAIAQQTQDWATFWLGFDPDNGSGNANKLLFAQWTSAQSNRYVYAAEDTDITPTQSNNAASSLGRLIMSTSLSGTILSYTPTIAVSPSYPAAFVAAYGASLDFSRTNGRATLAFKYQPGLSITATNATVAANLGANGYNFVGEFATANQAFNWYMDGGVSGVFNWADSYYNQIQLNNALQLALM